MKELTDYKFNSTYEFAALIDGFARYDAGYWNYNNDLFAPTVSKFSKDTILHQFITFSLSNYHRRLFRKLGIDDEEQMDYWYDLFDDYKVSIAKYNFDDDDPLEWYDKNEDNFDELFDKVSDEIFHVLFNNRGFLLEFNKLVANAIRESIIPEHFLTKKKTLKRVRIPEWVKSAVFHRDKGKCVYCQQDLTRVFNHLSKSNFDHMVPLDLFGANDPCNIQLTCEPCNKSKSNRESSTSTKYFDWWKRN